MLRPYDAAQIGLSFAAHAIPEYYPSPLKLETFPKQKPSGSVTRQTG
jgi:hypothetical protein